MKKHIQPYIPNPYHCFKCQKFGRGFQSCRGRLTLLTTAMADAAAQTSTVATQRALVSVLSEKRKKNYRTESEREHQRQSYYVLLIHLTIML